MAKVKQASAGKGISRALWPVMGFMVLCIGGAVGWVMAPTLIDYLAANIRGFRGNELPPEQMQAAFALIIALLVVSIFALIVGLAIPKDPGDVKEKEMAKEKDEIRKRDKERKKRKREIRLQQRQMDKRSGK